jgi:hypothetical protein
MSPSAKGQGKFLWHGGRLAKDGIALFLIESNKRTAVARGVIAMTYAA